MAGKKLPIKGKNRNYYYVFVIIVISGSLALTAYAGLKAHAVLKPASLHLVVAGLVFAVSLLLLLIIALFSLTYDKKLKDDKYVKELKAFKKFTDTLLHASDELAAYAILCGHMTGLPGIDRAVVLYRAEGGAGPDSWETIPEGEQPVCSMSLSACPIFEHGQRCIADDAGNEALRCPYQLRSCRRGSYLCNVFGDGDCPSAVIQLYSERENVFEPSLTYQVDSYIEIAAPIIASKRAISVLNRKASTDRLTKLYNRNFLDPYLENQIAAASLSKQQISLIMVDMDHFKAINDTYGHVAGDHVLSLFAQLVLKCVRKTDLIARYGGDEFIVVLPSTDTETAGIIAERIRQTVSEAYIPPIEGVSLPSISCSVGVSTYPVHCSSKDDLIRTSDIALYRAKQSGRNQTIVYCN